MDLAPWITAIVALLLQKKTTAAVGVLIVMICKRLFTRNRPLRRSNVLQRLLAFDDEDDIDMLPSFSATFKKRKLFMIDALQHIRNEQDAFDDFMLLCLSTIRLLDGPCLRLQRRWWKDPTRPGSMFRFMEVDWPLEDVKHPGKLDENYLWHFRFRYEDFCMLEELLAGCLPPCGGDGYWPNLHEPLTPRNKLAITLYWLAKGAHYGEVAAVFDVGISTICGIVRQVTTESYTECQACTCLTTCSGFIQFSTLQFAATNAIH